MAASYGAFLSYSHVDNRHDSSFVTWLRDYLSSEVQVRTGRPFAVFIDHLDIAPGENWNRRLEEALERSEFIIPVVTPSYVASDFCRQELLYFADLERRRGRTDHIIPLDYVAVPTLDDDGPELQQDDVLAVLARTQRVPWREVREGGRKRRIAAARALADLIVRRSSATPLKPVQPVPRRPRLVNGPPRHVPNRFLDRRDAVTALEGRLQDPVATIAVLVGGPGLGKTAVVSELVARLESDRSDVHFDAVDYIAGHGHRPLTAATLLGDLADLHPDAAVRSRLQLQNSTQDVSWRGKLDRTLTALDDHRVLLVLDDVDELLSGTGHRAVADLIRRLADRRGHGVRVLLVGSVRPEFYLRGHRPSDVVVLGNGLPKDDLDAFLSGLDPEGLSPLAYPTPGQRETLFDVTRGTPRLLELVLSVVRDAPGPALSQLLAELGSRPQGERAGYLIDRALSCQSPEDLRLLQILAAFLRPVTAAAVNRLLGRDSGRDLTRLCARRLVRQDGEAYYLPPAEAEHVFARIERGDDADRRRTPMPQTQLALLHHAANYFADQASRTEAHGVEQLSPHFGEIELRIRGGELREAFELIAALDKAQLQRSGHSDALSAFREQLAGKLGDPWTEARNLVQLANAKSQQEDHDAAMAALRRAQDRNAGVTSRGRREAGERTLLLAIAGVHYDDGQVTQAHAEYEAALGLHPPQRDPVREAQAHSGAALCLTEIGKFELAARRQDLGLAVIDGLNFGPAESLRTELLFNQGLTHLYAGRTMLALERFDDVRGRLDPKRDPGLVARCLDARATALVDLNSTEAAALASEAGRIAATLPGSPELARIVFGTVTLVNLVLDDEVAALAAAEAAAEFGRRSRGWGTYAMRGIARLRNRDPEGARADFLQTRENTRAMLLKEGSSYQVHEYDGLASAGLALLDDDPDLRPAERAYQNARIITSARGAVRLCLLRLDMLLASGAGPGMERLRAAAGG